MGAKMNELVEELQQRLEEQIASESKRADELAASATAEMNEQLSKAKSQNDDLQTQLVEMQKQVQAAAEEKASLNVQVEELNQKVNEGPQVVEVSNTAELEAAQSEVASLKEQLTKSASDLEELKEKNNKEAVTEVQSSVRSKLSKVFPQVDAKDFDEFVNAVAESASKTADSEEVEKLQQELGEAKEAESR